MKGDEMKFVAGLFIGMASIIILGSTKGDYIVTGHHGLDKRSKNKMADYDYERVRAAVQEQAERDKQRTVFETQIGLPNFVQRFEKMEIQVNRISEIPSIKRQLKYRARRDSRRR